MAALRLCLQQNQAHLKHLSVGFVSSANAPDHLACVLGVAGPGSGPRDGSDAARDSEQFPALLSLCLSNFYFPRLEVWDHAPPLFYRLRRLTLRHCVNQRQLLRSLARAARLLQLRHVEVCSDDLFQAPMDPPASLAIIDFLLAFQGLRHLHLQVSNLPVSLPGFGDALRHHQSTLQSIIYHERRLVPIDNDRTFEDVRDVSPSWAREMPQLLRHHPSTAMGLCLNPVAARDALQPVAHCVSVRLLHLRFSGAEHLHRDIQHEITSALRSKQHLSSPSLLHGDHRGMEIAEDKTSNGTTDDCSCCSTIWDPAHREIAAGSLVVSPSAQEFLAFADWAFGPTGLPTLQVLAFGDFSHGERYRRQQFMVGRNTWVKRFRGDTYAEDRPYFYPVAPTDALIWDGLLPNGLEFLSACPISGLFESPYDL
ncbi:hypothetical protein BDV40DRAFT_283846 [Aspergillus tamarii]|uniref:Uncharacterized protein n=1 Tax=Aspergillus tamarii TaxID=41984 RepID=A0A5N6U9W2_ASPTM|nr:hypothetical protein BDV40DRAFT_283846 [Aspergillus tamarii]